MNQKGYIMLEVIFISLLLTALVSVIGIYAIGTRMIVSSSNLTTASFLGQKQMAYVVSDQSNLALEKIETQDKTAAISLVKNGTMFKITTNIKEIESHLKHITVTVAWEEWHMIKKIEITNLVFVDE